MYLSYMRREEIGGLRTPKRPAIGVGTNDKKHALYVNFSEVISTPLLLCLVATDHLKGT